MDRLQRAQPSRRSPMRRALLVCAILAAVAYAPIASALADEPFRGAEDIHLGENVHAAFPSPPEGPHRYSFFATANTTVSASVRRDAGASLAPLLRLTYPGGVRIDLGRALRDGARGPRIDRFAVRFAGTYVIEVVAGEGSGGYTLTTDGRIGRRQRGIFPAAPRGESSFGFDAQLGTSLSVLVAPAEAGPRIEITGLTAPSGDDIPVLSLQKGPAAEIRNVILSEQGRFRVRWNNSGTPGDLQLQFRFGAPAKSPVRELGVSDGIAVSVIERGDPALAARDGYVGSAACGRCHDELVRSWSGTAHNSAVRSWNRAGLSGLTMANDANANGSDDFRDGLDLASTPAFAAYATGAPKLSFVAGDAIPNQVRIGTTTYLVHRTMGGNGLWMQRYLTKIAGNDFVLPFEYDEVRRAYRVYRAGDWYDALNNPRPSTGVPRDRSFEAQCSGCHNTGVTLAGGQSGVDTGYVEMNIGCEQCHGPGAAHAAGGDARKIENPRRLMTQAVPDPAAANDVCARCHSKGESVATLPGLSANAEFGFAQGRVAQPGDRIADFLKPTEAPSDFWGFKVSPLPALPGNTSVASRSDRQHGPDIAIGTHGPGGERAAACFDCHDPHRSRAEYQVATSVRRDIRVATRSDDNSLCLACHAGDPQFPGISVADAAAIHGGTPPASVARGVIDHMKDIGMPVRDGFYDPVGTGVGRCTTCHMPTTASSAGFGTDKGGFIAGELHSHRFEIVWPRASVAYGVTNSCNVCHPTTPGDIVGPILAEWANPTIGHTSFHGATPPATQDGIALNAAINPARSGGVLCISCHTAEGFTRVQVNGQRVEQAEVDQIAKGSVARDKGVSCDACHGRRGDGQFYGTDANPLRLSKADLCTSCHNAATIEFSDFRDHGAVVRHPQKEMLEGNAGDAAPGAPATATTAHSFMQDRCVTCHYDASHALGRHDFKPNAATCTECHKGLATFDRPASGDYDGNGLTSGIQTEVTGLLSRLRTAILADPKMTFASGRFDYLGATDHALTGASQAQSRAVFNWYSVEDDGSRGVHNTARAVQLLQSSYRELTGTNVPGATIR